MSFLGLKPTFLRKGTSFSLHSSYLQGGNAKRQPLCKLQNDAADETEQGDRVFSKPFQAPVHGGVVHLVDEDDEMFDSGRLRQHGVLPRLAALLKARLELPLPG